MFISKLLNIVSILQEKIPKFEQDFQNKILDECSSTLENFLVKHSCIFHLINS